MFKIEKAGLLPAFLLAPGSSFSEPPNASRLLLFRECIFSETVFAVESGYVLRVDLAAAAAVMEFEKASDSAKQSVMGVS